MSLLTSERVASSGNDHVVASSLRKMLEPASWLVVGVFTDQP
jgi:hypothetical protein